MEWPEEGAARKKERQGMAGNGAAVARTRGVRWAGPPEKGAEEHAASRRKAAEVSSSVVAWKKRRRRGVAAERRRSASSRKAVVLPREWGRKANSHYEPLAPVVLYNRY